MSAANLSNWRKPPHNVWAFRHVDEIVATRRIAASQPAALVQGKQLNISALQFRFEDRQWSLDETFAETDGDSLLVLLNGHVVHESYKTA